MDPTVADQERKSFRALLAATTDAIAIHRKNEIVYANHAALALFGFASLEEVIGRSVFDFVGSGFRALVADRVFRGYTQRTESPEIEELLVSRDGHDIPVEVFSVPVAFEGEPATLVHIRDISARRALEVRLRAADRLASVGLVAAGIAHEINTPLTYALCNLDLLAERFERGVLTDEMRVMLGCVRDGLEQATRVASQVKMLSRSEPWQTSPVDVQSVLDWCAKLVSNHGAGRVRIVKEYGAVPMVQGNDARLAQVFLNIILNAVEAMPKDAAEHTITLRTAPRGSTVLVEVSDTGPGIPPELVKRIFEPLFTTKERGTGLGLSICKTLLDEEGGTLEVDSKLGRGSVFRVKLRAATSEHAGRQKPLTVRSHGKRILIVEDEARLATTLQHVLDAHTVAIASSGRAALDRLLAGERFDLILCDLVMPDVDGPELYRKIREGWPGLEARIVFLSGGAFTVRLTAFLRSVPNRYLEKPFEPAELIQIVDEMLAPSTS